MMRKASRYLPFALALGASVPNHTAHAQINPFGSQLNRNGLSDDDFALLSQSGAKLNALPSVAVGQSESWNNPKTTSSGTTTVTRIWQFEAMPCHDLRYAFLASGQPPQRVYDLTWCRTPDGAWKIKS